MQFQRLLIHVIALERASIIRGRVRAKVAEHETVQANAEAANWYRLAADQGKASAQFKLGVLYDQGIGVLQDYAEAMKWYLKAADQNFAPAQYNLGGMCLEGRGVPEDFVQAHMWFNLSSQAQDSRLTTQDRDMTARLMTPAQIAEAQKLAREWKPTKQSPR